MNLLQRPFSQHLVLKYHFKNHLESSFFLKKCCDYFHVPNENRDGIIAHYVSTSPTNSQHRRHRNSISALFDYTVKQLNVFRGSYSQATGESHINLDEVQLNRNEQLHNYEINCFSILPTETFSSQSEFPNVHSNFNDSSNGFYTSQIIEEQSENHHMLLLIQCCQIYCSQQTVSMQILPPLFFYKATTFPVFFFFLLLKEVCNACSEREIRGSSQYWKHL